MRHATPSFLCLAVLTLSLGACQDIATLDFSPAAGQPGSVRGTVLGSVSATHEPGGLGASGLPVCSPEAIAWAPDPIGELPGALGTTCGLQSVLVDANADGVAESVTDYLHDGNTVTVSHHAAHASPGPRTVYTLDAAGRAVSIESQDANGVMLSTDVRRFDSAGHIELHESKSISGYGSVKTVHVSSVEQTWSGGRLVERRDSSSWGGNSAHTKWTYDAAGRMVTVVHASGATDAVVARADWSYDAAGRPVRVERRAHDKLTMLETWTWAADGRLIRRTAELHPGKGYAGNKLDSYDAPTGSTGSGTCYGCGGGVYGGGSNAVAWADAMPAARDGCQPVPTAIGHGYPEADYAFGGDWSTAGQEDGGDVYGYGYGYEYGYGYGYGSGSGGATWYGHGGAGSNWDALAVNVPHTSARFDIRYDAQGRMIAETLEVEPTDPKSKAPRKVIRQREFSGHSLDTDRVIMANGLEVRALRFLRDADGRVARRELTVTGHIAEFDTWSRDTAGRAIEHERFAQAQPWKVLAANAVTPDLAVPAPVASTRRTRTYDTAGHVVEQRVFLPKSAASVFHRTQAFDTAGRLIERATDTSGVESKTVESWVYDAQGRETLQAIAFPSNKFGQNWYTARTYDAAGWPAMVEQGHDPAHGATWRQTFVYGCP